MAGGQSLMAMLNLRLLEPAVVIDIARLAELDYIKVVGDKILGDKVEVGAAVTQNRLKDWPQLAAKLPLLARALPFVGHFQTRNRGTVCGSIAHADPSSEIPLSLATLGGEVVLRSRRGTRTLAAADFQRGMLQTAREPEELITAVRFPDPCGRPRGVPRGRAPARRFRHDRGRGVGSRAAAPSGSASAASPTGPRCARSASMAPTRRNPRSKRSPGSSKATTTSTPSARLRRDLLRRVGPAVVEEALRCAA